MGSDSRRSISLETARLMAVVKQGLHQRPAAAGKRELLEIVHRIGLLQLDTIHVVARSHYLVMLSRAGLYDRSDLDSLLYPDRTLFEQWAHAACLIPSRDYPQFAPLFSELRSRSIKVNPQYFNGDDPQQMMASVMAEIERRGPLSSLDFESTSDQAGSWWNWKPAKEALVLMYRHGHLMVDRREKFRIFYDLAERVLPGSTQPTELTLADYFRWAAAQGLARLGAATEKMIADYYRLSLRSARAGIDELLAQGEIVPVRVADWAAPTYLLAADLPLLESVEAGEFSPMLTTFLTPFDNLIWDRFRTRDLFDFEYKIEVYTPAAKRKYGYYVMPILHNGRLVGRIDPKADRQNGCMIIRAIYLEPGESVSSDLVQGIAGALREFAAFHGGLELRIEQSTPAALAKALRAAL